MTRMIALLLALTLSAAGLTACAQDGSDSAARSATPAPLADAALAQPTYPKLTPYPTETAYLAADGSFDSDGFSAAYDAWQKEQQTLRQQPEGYQDGLWQFYQQCLPAFFQDGQTENELCSPLNLYLALSMLTEVTDGDSRAQLQAVLGSQDQAVLREQAHALWNANYNDDGAVTCRLAASLWLDDQVPYQQTTLDTLVNHYYASAFQGDMGSPSYNQAFQSWLNEQTGGMLTEQAEGMELPPDTLLALATTLFYRAQWSTQFQAANTKAECFHGAEGDVTCDFLHQSGDDAYFWGDQFTAIAQGLENSGSMWFFLPKDGIAPKELLQDKQVQQLLQAPNRWEQMDYVIVNRSIPKFDITSDLNLRDSLESLGVTAVFDQRQADFSPLTETEQPVYLSQAQHTARVTIDEEGCAAAAFTVMAVEAMSMPPQKEVDFRLDRPFLFVLTGEDGTPLFVGIVRQP